MEIEKMGAQVGHEYYRRKKLGVSGGLSLAQAFNQLST